VPFNLQSTFSNPQFRFTAGSSRKPACILSREMNIRQETDGEMFPAEIKYFRFTMKDRSARIISRAIRVRGTVQGVGFRPFVYRLAFRFGIRGSVKNDGAGVAIEAAGLLADLDKFIACLKSEAPPLSSVTSVEVSGRSASAPAPETFVIAESSKSEMIELDIARDTATCDACLAEMRDKADRRFGHPFINCTDCGPRYTIINKLPYDRPNTAMAGFEMCPNCRREFEDPASRRFHAQPICCPDCGPRLELLDQKGSLISTDDPIAACIEWIAAGQIGAIKGIGGYHLACRADDGEIVSRLRSRKNREEKPFALMARDCSAAELIVWLSPDDRRLLESIERPIVLCRKRDDLGGSVAPGVAPGLSTLGIMLPYTPVHHLLFDRSDFKILIMTSANRSDEPMVHDDVYARTVLDGIADFYLSHDRPVLVRTDDSIARIVAGSPLLLRRGRGFVPEPLPAPRDVTGVVGCGGVLKSTVSVGRGTSCYVSQYVGNVENLETLDQLESIKRHLLDVLGVSPVLFVADLHPGTLSGRIADAGAPLLRVQHHHAHAAACMAENRLTGKTVCVVYDGTGYGDDGTVWGSEILIADYHGYERFGHPAPMLMPGGDSAILHPWRMAMGALYPLRGEAVVDLFPAIAEQERLAVLDLLRNSVSCVQTCGMGRLFDSLSALLNVCTRRSYEGQPAMALEAIVDPVESGTYDVPLNGMADGSVTWQPAALLGQALADFRRGSGASAVAGRFHATVAEITARIAVQAAEKAKTGMICLTGGCFQNAILLEKTAALLKKAGLQPIVHRMVPPNDESISYGQLVIGAMRPGAGMLSRAQ
jgi:hydrogenase maturation protein HypF